MERKINIIEIKNLLRAQLKLFSEKQIRLENALYEKSIYEEIISNFNLDDLEVFESNIFSLSLQMPLIFGDEKAKYLEYELYKLLYLIKKLKNNYDLKDELNRAMNKLQDLINSIISDYKILCNKLKEYEKDYKQAKNNAYFYRGALYKLNVKAHISDDQMSATRNLIRKSEYTPEEEIVMMELLNHHNIRVKYDKPILSFTTIKMMESEFVDYVLEDLKRDKKLKLDEYAHSIFDAIMYANDDQNHFELTKGIITLMSQKEQEYVLKRALNIFLAFLRECKADMLEDNAYEDLEIRKMIIAEYNSYYYKYKGLDEILHNYLDQRNEIKQDYDFSTINSIEHILEPQQNNLFFARGASKAYVERDILDIPEEYYQRVKKLLEGFKNNVLPESNIETFVSNSSLKGYRKLKEDQIRIPFRKISGNNYLILGIMLKKSNDANKQYTNMIKRDYDFDISTNEIYYKALEENEMIYSNLISLLDKHSRKGNR